MALQHDRSHGRLSLLMSLAHGHGLRSCSWLSAAMLSEALLRPGFGRASRTVMDDWPILTLYHSLFLLRLFILVASQASCLVLRTRLRAWTISALLFPALASRWCLRALSPSIAAVLAISDGIHSCPGSFSWFFNSFGSPCCLRFGVGAPLPISPPIPIPFADGRGPRCRLFTWFIQRCWCWWPGLCGRLSLAFHSQVSDHLYSFPCCEFLLCTMGIIGGLGSISSLLFVVLANSASP